MTSERLLSMSIEVLYLPKNFYTPKTKFWLRPWLAQIHKECKRDNSQNSLQSNFYEI